MSRILIFSLLLVVSSTSLAQDTSEPQDMKQCIEAIRNWGMSEHAKSSLAMVAGMRIGGSTWTYRKDPASGAYWNAFTGNRCNLPNDNPEEAKRERDAYQYKMEKEIMKLKPLADSDKSGFVSSEEADNFRSLVEFGYKAAYVSKEENGDVKNICLGLMPDMGSTEVKALKAKVSAYETLRQMAEQSGVEGFPVIDLNL